jgi:hypothetical protein
VSFRLFIIGIIRHGIVFWFVPYIKVGTLHPKLPKPYTLWVSAIEIPPFPPVWARARAGEIVDEALQFFGKVKGGGGHFIYTK